jgi:voltage-gated potassium channel Kch
MPSTPRSKLSGAGARVRELPRPNVVERRMTKFLQSSPSVRLAASVIVTATLIVVVGGGALMRILDHKEYSTVWVGMWWAIQTVTTVGYGDVTPKAPVGRLVAAFVMLEGIAFVAIVTAGITSAFVARAEEERAAAEDAADDLREDAVDARFDDITQRLDRLESLLRRLGSST